MPQRRLIVQTLVIAFLLGLLFWLADALVQRYYFAENLRLMMFEPPETLLDTLLFKIGGHTLFMRLSFLAACLIGGLIAVLHIRQQQTSKEALHESEKRFQYAMEATTDGLYDWNIQTNDIYYSPGYFTMLGYEPDELPHTFETYEKLLHPEDAKHSAEKLSRYLSGESGDSAIEMRFKSKSGEWMWVLSRGKIVEVDTAGQPLRFVGTNVNINARKKAEEALQESERLLNVTGKIGKISGWEHNLATGKATWTQALYDIFGIPYNQEPPGVDEHLSHYPSRDRKILEQAYNQAIKSGTPFDIELQVYTATKKLIWCRVQGEPVYENGRCVVMRGVLQDITERKQAEEALKEYSERLEEMVDERTKELKDAQEELIRKEKLATLGELAGSVAHELRNPLGVLANVVYFLKMTLPDADDKTKEYLDILSRQVRKSGKIVSDLLDFSRTRLTETTEREKVIVSTLVTRVLAEHPLPDSIDVSTQIDTDLPPVWVNPQQIEQVLTNLVTNACQAMLDGGELTISATTQEDEVAISVRDTGCGISLENLTKLFEPLFTTKAKGFGLGLAVSRNLLQTNGGHIEVESKEGEGTIFTVTLPTQLKDDKKRVGQK
jgi:PAS domain S-box-containing protein